MREIGFGRTQCGAKIVEWVNFAPELIVRNKLSKKPQKAVPILKEMVEGPNAVVKCSDVSVRQDYGKGTVTLNLLSQSFVAGGGEWAKGTDQGQHIQCSRVLPATAAVKRYAKALKEMVENPVKETIETPVQTKPKKKWYEIWK